MNRTLRGLAVPMFAGLALFAGAEAAAEVQRSTAGRSSPHVNDEAVPPAPAAQFGDLRGYYGGYDSWYSPAGRVPVYGPPFPGYGRYGWGYATPGYRVYGGWYGAPVRRPLPYGRRPIYRAGAYWYGGSFPRGQYFYRMW